MEFLLNLTNVASNYPKDQVFRDVHPFLLDSYFRQLNKLDNKLFHKADRASIDFWEYISCVQSFEEETLTNVADLEKKLWFKEPICRFMFVEATYGEKLKITREMLTLTLSYHQVLPCFLEFLFPFARDLYHSDFHFGGFRHQVRFSAEDKGLDVPGRGWSGLDLKVCYNFKSVEHDERLGSKEWPWYMGQSAIHHSFDVETGQASWIIVEGDQRLRHRIKSATKDQSVPRFSFHTREKAFASTLAVHLIFCEWSGQTWRWYINFLDKEIQSSTKAAVFSLLETPVSSPEEVSASNIRQRRRKQSNHNTPKVSIQATELPTSGSRPTKDTGFSFSDLQGTHAIEEIVNNANLLMKVNQNVLTELREAYKSFEDSPGWPASLSSNCRGDLTRFDQRVASIQNDMAIQQSRVEKLLRLISDRKSLLYGILDQQNIQLGKQQAEQAQKSAWRMEDMTLTVQDLTKDMHLIARETREETISMRIMALIALAFLPGTFASTMMSTKIFQASNDEEYHKALGQFFGIFVPLFFVTPLSWYLARKWHTYKTDGTKHEKET